MGLMIYLDEYAGSGQEFMLNLRRTGIGVPTITLSGVEVTDLKTVFSTGKPASMAPETTPLDSKDEQKIRKSLMEAIENINTKPDDYDNVLKCCREIGSIRDLDSLEVVLVRQNAIKSLLDSMKRYPESAEINLEASKSLLEQVRNSDASLHYLTTNDGIERLHTNLDTFSSNVETIEVILDIFGHISFQDEWRAVLTEKVNPSDFLTTMARHDCDVTIIEKCCIVVGNLVLSEDIARSMMYVGGVHSIISMMTKYSQNTSILKHCCTALGTFASHDDTCQAVSEAGATCAVMSVMTSFPDNPAILESCCWALASLTRAGTSIYSRYILRSDDLQLAFFWKDYSRRMRMLFLAANRSKHLSFRTDCVCMELMCTDSFIVLLKAMTSFPLEMRIQEYGCWALCNLVVMGSRLTDELCQQAMGILVDSMTSFSHCVELLEHICFSINILISIKESVRETFVRKDGISKLIELMKSYEESVDIQTNGCKTLGNLAVNADFRRFSEDMGSSEAIISCMLRLDKIAQIQNSGCMALTNLSADVPDNKYRILKNGGVHAVLTAMTTFREDEQIQTNALKVLCNLIESDKGCWWIAEENGIQIIAMTLKAFFHSSDVLAFGCACLSNLPRRGMNVVALENIETTLLYLRMTLSVKVEVAQAVCTFYDNCLKAGKDCMTLFDKKAMETVVDIVSEFNDYDVKICGLKVFARIAMGDDHSLVSKRLGNVLISTMEGNLDDHNLQMICCATISYLSSTEKGLEAMQELCCIDVILQSMKAHVREPEILTICLLSLENICRAGLVRGRTTQRVCDAVALSMKSHSTNNDIQMGGSEILSIIGSGFHKENEQRRQSVDFIKPITGVIHRNSVTEDIIEAATAALQRIKKFKDVLDDNDDASDREENMCIEMKDRQKKLLPSPKRTSVVEEMLEVPECSD